MKTHFFAVDLGATSGRTILGTMHDGKCQLEELTRFENRLIQTGGHYYWDIYALYSEIVRGLQLVAQRQIPIHSIGIDTWGVDFALVGDDGHLLRNPIAYRDPYTVERMEEYLQTVKDRAYVYGKTGIQFMNFNSIFQLYAMQREGNAALKVAKKILFIPDALIYMLTGRQICEYTIASTSGLLNPRTQDLDEELLATVGLQRSQFGPIVMPGTQVGPITGEVQRMTGLGAVPVVAVAGHDTASAVAAVPARDARFAYLSSGTWSLMGIETAHPVITQRSYDLNFTNEGGIEGTTRFLKNICGMWLYERCRQEWPESVRALPHAQLQATAMEVDGFRSLINPDHPDFANPVSMTKAIQDYCRRTGQYVPQTPAEFCRCIFDSLALRYRQVFSWLREVAEEPIDLLHIIGGGSLNDYLNQFTSDALGIEVKAGPQEGTALGNVMLQAKACGMVGDVWEMRRIIADSIALKTFQPCDTALWDEAYETFLRRT